jgi:hypothetical protein
VRPAPGHAPVACCSWLHSSGEAVGQAPALSVHQRRWALCVLDGCAASSLHPHPTPTPLLPLLLARPAGEVYRLLADSSAAVRHAAAELVESSLPDMGRACLAQVGRWGREGGRRRGCWVRPAARSRCCCAAAAGEACFKRLRLRLRRQHGPPTSPIGLPLPTFASAPPPRPRPARGAGRARRRRQQRQRRQTRSCSWRGCWR